MLFLRSWSTLSHLTISKRQSLQKRFVNLSKALSMDTLVRLNADELNQSLIDFIKTSFKGKRIAVHIYEDAMDETEYLLSDPVHKEKILKSVEEVNRQKGLVTYTIDELKTMFLNEDEK